MTSRRAGTWIEALERARTELEIALQEDADWRTLRRARSRSKREAHERALAGSPVYRAWRLLSQATREIRAGTALPEAAPQPPDGDGGAIRARAERTARRRRVGLREVLERVRSEAVLDREALPASVSSAGDGSAGAPADVVGDAVDDSARPRQTASRLALPDAEEATVSFVVREAVEPAAPDGEPRGQPAAEGSEQPPLPDAAAAPDAAGRAAEAGDAEARDAGGDEAEAEAEVVIVPRSR